MENYRKRYGGKIILINDLDFSKEYSQELEDQNDNNIKLDSAQNQSQKDLQRKLFLGVIRKFNNSFADRVVNLLTKLQEEKLNKSKINLNLKNLPNSNFNPHQLRQQIFNGFEKVAFNNGDINEKIYFENIQKFIKEESFNLVLFDLYAILRQFKKFLPMGNNYLFFHEIQDLKSENKPSGNRKNRIKNGFKYPIFLVETNIEENEDKLILQSTRDIVIINTPAINSLEFKNIITTPRAARFSDTFSYLKQAEKHIQDIYNFDEPFLFVQHFPTLIKEDFPKINFRIGFQIVERENRKLLDYSEPITLIDASRGDKFIDMMKNYVSGNVENTTDEVDGDYREKYPRKSVNNLISQYLSH